MRTRFAPLLTLSGLLALAACKDIGMPMEGDEAKNAPQSVETLKTYAKNAEAQGDFKEAMQLYQHVLEKTPGDKNVRLSLADATRQSGDNDKAISEYDLLLASDPNMISAVEGKGLALLAEGNFDAAQPFISRVVTQDPMRWKALNAAGIIFSAHGDSSAADSYFKAALGQSPYNPSVVNNLALSQAVAHNYPSAIQGLTEAAQLARDNPEKQKHINLNLALVYAAAGQFDNAKTIASHYYTGASLDNNLGLYAHLAKDDQLAKTYLNMALTENASYYPKAWENLDALRTGETPPLAPVVAQAVVPGQPSALPLSGSIPLSYGQRP